MASEIDTLVEKTLEQSRRIDQGMDTLKASIETVLAEHRRMRELLRRVREDLHPGHFCDARLCRVVPCPAITAALDDIPERP